MNYPVKIRLTKLETLENAPYPQEARFPSNSTVKEGLMWEFSEPKVGDSFRVLVSKLSGCFYTSEVKKIETNNDGSKLLTTLNSKYKLEVIE